jgi:heme exporter protein C
MTTNRILLAVSTVCMVVLLGLVFMVLPEEKTQGFVQKIFYLHVPIAWVSFLAFGVTGYRGLRYLMTRDLAHDRTAAASAEIGVIFVSLALITGSLWGRPVWGIWWTWDLRLTTTFILWLLYISYLILRRAVGDRERRAMLSAVVGLLGFLDVPLVYAANRVKASQHPSPVVGGGEDSGLATEFLVALLLGVFTMTVFYSLLLRLRTELSAIEDDIETLWLERS